MARPLRRLRPLLDAAARRFGYVPAGMLQSQLKLEGNVYIRPAGEDEVHLGANVLTEKMRINAAGLLARRAADWGFPVVYDGGIEGYATTVDDVFPTHVAVGTGVTSAATTQTTMDAPLLKAGAVAYYPLQEVFFRTDPSLYPSNIPISVSYFFPIPGGESYDGVGTDVDFQEFALFGPNRPALLPSMSATPVDNDMLARKVRRFSKLSTVDLVLRWEFST